MDMVSVAMIIAAIIAAAAGYYVMKPEKNVTSRGVRAR